MSGDNDFLARWSRRKQEAKTDSSPIQQVDDDNKAIADDSRIARAAEAEPEFDLASLPSLESITSATDVTGFLHKRVPLDLARAALRRAWAVDPAIRDFIGLAENAWDFTDPNAMPGFGPLEPTDDIARMVAGIMNRASPLSEPAGIDPADRPLHAEKSAGDFNDIEKVASGGPVMPPVVGPDAGIRVQSEATSTIMRDQNPDPHNLQYAAPRETPDNADGTTIQPRRKHGGALPV